MSLKTGDEPLCQMFDITSQTKWAVFHLISKHSLNINFLCISSWNIDDFEKHLSRINVSW